ARSNHAGATSPARSVTAGTTGSAVVLSLVSTSGTRSWKQPSTSCGVGGVAGGSSSGRRAGRNDAGTSSTASSRPITKYARLAPVSAVGGAGYDGIQREARTLERINHKPAAEFWKEAVCLVIDRTGIPAAQVARIRRSYEPSRGTELAAIAVA